MGVPTNRRQPHFFNHLSHDLNFTPVHVPVLARSCRFKSSSVSDVVYDIRVETAQTELQVLGIEI
jgi:hypothetical protein